MKLGIISNSLSKRVAGGFNLNSFASRALLRFSMRSAVSVSEMVAAACVEHFASPDFETENISSHEEEWDKFRNKDKVFKSDVDVEALYDTIKTDFMPYLTKKSYWFSVWTVLRTNGYLNMGKNRVNFCRRMKLWYKDEFSLTCLDTYAATRLTDTNWLLWEEEVFGDFERNETNTTSHSRTSLRTARKLLELCKIFDRIIKEKNHFRND